MTTLPGLEAKIAAFDREAMKRTLDAVDVQLHEVWTEFPLEAWPDLQLERYALGLDREVLSFCRKLEFGTPDIGGIGGGSAAKHIMYFHSDGHWRMASPLKGLDPHEAWGRLRSEFVLAFDAVRAGEVERLDELELLTWGAALTTKALAIYFPDEFLPVFSLDHLRYFISLFGEDIPAGPTWALNRRLRTLVRECPMLDGWQPHEVMNLLYAEYDPRKLNVLKVAPGEAAKWWPDCQREGYIAVGWDEVGDLTRYESDAELQEALGRWWPESRGGHLALARRLLSFRDLEIGDIVVANHGKSRVLAVGKVVGPYRYTPERAEGHHLVAIDWDASYEQTLPAQQGWQSTIVRVRPTLWATIQLGRRSGARIVANPAKSLPDDVQQVIDGLKRKGQVILYGVPGTGKTRLAYRAALAMAGRSAQDDEASAAIAAALDPTLAASPIRLVTFHPTYDYEDFVEGYKPKHVSADQPQSGLVLELRDGIFKQLCDDALAAPDRQFIMIIDELNRGDQARIFGELVSLLEVDKRGIPVTLPRSGRTFSVPDNVYIIATMNVADRSIGQLDAAIRRRFACIGVAPDPDALPGSIGPLVLANFLEAVNQRIVRFLGADMQIGHSFLLEASKPIAEESQLHAVFYNEIVPLLEDYAVGRAELMEQLFGELYAAGNGELSRISPTDLPGRLAAEFDAASVDMETEA
jgi:5-methylcytosine-specific restriction protein B